MLLKRSLIYFPSIILFDTSLLRSIYFEEKSPPPPDFVLHFTPVFSMFTEVIKVATMARNHLQG